MGKKKDRFYMNSKALEFIEKRIQHYLDNFDGDCATLGELYMIKGVLTKTKPVRFECGAEQEINVRFDSHYAMIQDLVKQLDI